MVNHEKGRRLSLEKSLDRRGYTLRDKILFYRTLRRHTYIIMSLLIVFLLFLNYTNITYINEHQCGFQSQNLKKIEQIDTEAHTEQNSVAHINSSAGNKVRDHVVEPVVQPTTVRADWKKPKKMTDIDDKKAGTENETIRSYQFRIPDFFEIHSNLKRTLEPKYLLSNRRSHVKMVMGVPTVKRKEVSYLKSMLTSLFEAMELETEKTKNETLVVIMIAELEDISFIKSTIEELKQSFMAELKSGLLEILVPESDFYPNFDHLPPDRIFADRPSRVKWRTKQNYDISYLMAYCHTKGMYYLQLEDDIASMPGFISTIYRFMSSEAQGNWYSLEFCDLGFIGKLFKSRDLVHLVNYFLMFSDYMPVDILSMIYQRNIICDPSKASKECGNNVKSIVKRHKKSLFQHIGLMSSLDGKLQKLKSKKFREDLTIKKIHKNPPASIMLSSSLQTYSTYTLEGCYAGVNQFWGFKQNPNDSITSYVTFIFDPPVILKSFTIKSGNIFHPSDTIPVNSVIQIKKDRAFGGFINLMQVGKNENEIITGTLNARQVGKISQFRISIPEYFNNWILIRYIEFKIWDGKDANTVHKPAVLDDT